MKNICLALLFLFSTTLMAQVPGNMPGMSGMVDPSEVPAAYEFDWNYKLKMEGRQTDATLHYLLKENTPYFGIRMQKENSHMVMDPEREMTVMYMNKNGRKMMMATSMAGMAEKASRQERKKSKELTISKIPGKTILGYNCSGYRGENDEVKFTYYVTTEPGVSFTGFYNTEKTELPEHFESSWLADADGIMMQMNMEHKKDPAKNFTLSCVELEQTDYSLNKSDYKTMSGF